MVSVSVEPIAFINTQLEEKWRWKRFTSSMFIGSLGADFIAMFIDQQNVLVRYRITNWHRATGQQGLFVREVPAKRQTFGGTQPVNEYTVGRKVFFIRTY